MQSYIWPAIELAPVSGGSTSANQVIEIGYLQSIDNKLTAPIPVTFSSGPVSTASVFGEELSVVSGVETTIVSYTAGAGVDTYLQLADVAGDSVGIQRIYIDGTKIDQKYMSYTAYSFTFNYESTVTGAPGLLIAPGSIVTVKVLQTQPNSADFNARIQVLIVG